MSLGPLSTVLVAPTLEISQEALDALGGVVGIAEQTILNGNRVGCAIDVRMLGDFSRGEGGEAVAYFAGRPAPGEEDALASLDPRRVRIIVFEHDLPHLEMAAAGRADAEAHGHLCVLPEEARKNPGMLSRMVLEFVSGNAR